MNKITIASGIVVIIFIILTGLMIYDIVSTKSFCKSEGYNYYHTYTEKGYIACCKSIVKDHIKTDDKICESFEDKRIFGGN